MDLSSLWRDHMQAVLWVLCAQRRVKCSARLLLLMQPGVTHYSAAAKLCCGFTNFSPSCLNSLIFLYSLSYSKRRIFAGQEIRCCTSAHFTLCPKKEGSPVSAKRASPRKHTREMLRSARSLIAEMLFSDVH